MPRPQPGGAHAAGGRARGHVGDRLPLARQGSPDLDSPFLGLFPGDAPGVPAGTLPPAGAEPSLQAQPSAGPRPAASPQRPAPTPVPPMIAPPVVTSPAAPVRRAPIIERGTAQTGRLGQSGRRAIRTSNAPPARRGKEPVTSAPRPVHKDKDPVAELAITEIAGHLTFTPQHGHRLVLAARGALGVPPRRRTRSAARRRSPSSTPAWPASGCTCAARPGHSRPTSGLALSTQHTARPLPDVPGTPTGPTTWSPRSGI